MPASSEQPGAVIVVGSLHYDIMVDAPDRPRKGETVAGYRWRPKFGGKGGNQAVAAARAGAVTRMVGAVGADDFGTFLINGLDAAGVDRSHVCVLEGTASGMSVAISDDEGDYGAVIVSGSNLQIPDSSLEMTKSGAMPVFCCCRTKPARKPTWRPPDRRAGRVFSSA